MRWQSISDDGMLKKGTAFRVKVIEPNWNGMCSLLEEEKLRGDERKTPDIFVRPQTCVFRSSEEYFFAWNQGCTIEGPITGRMYQS